LTNPLKRFIEHACDALLTIGINPTGKRPGQAARRPDPPNRKTVTAKKKRKPKSLRATDRPISVLSTAVGNLINMTVTAVTSGSVLLGLLAAKRLL
jgi:hypothetical protein